MITESYQVKGMTCGHCASAVSTEVGAIPGVTEVSVDLSAGAVTVTSDAPVDPEQLRAAVDEAGYELVRP
ncbi:heavy-metal-associated domain-containing protein [Micromonospora sp. WMMD1102]|uniref:heavy-metal-associated domain-containing protein n=1 Tax=Micromonospora sp. WMMD1102 TaxID=3016105 RepID=UPI002414D65F|nr:heavy-metal-associated domain-containing protein [Micromonospora sp. WMMD1102]MDG4786946.1 heavy-metal-associated domain-containing protein [Micromonospora sp. WMMD1102]